MEEFYRLIEEKIRKSGYPGEISGREFYADVCDEADEQDLGMFLCIIKKSETLSYEVRIENVEDQIDLKTLVIHDGDKAYHVDFDAE